VHCGNINSVTSFEQLDPISTLYASIWEVLERHEPLMRLVDAHNLIKLSGIHREPYKPNRSTSDLPLLILIPVNSVWHFHQSSSHHSLIETLSLQLSTGDKRIAATDAQAAYLYPI